MTTTTTTRTLATTPSNIDNINTVIDNDCEAYDDNTITEQPNDHKNDNTNANSNTDIMAILTHDAANDTQTMTRTNTPTTWRPQCQENSLSVWASFRSVPKPVYRSPVLYGNGTTEYTIICDVVCAAVACIHVTPAVSQVGAT
jgi:hypothetical protein